MHAERDGLLVVHARTILLQGISSFTLRERIKSRVSNEAQSAWQQSVVCSQTSTRSQKFKWSI